MGKAKKSRSVSNGGSFSEATLGTSYVADSDLVDDPANELMPVAMESPERLLLAAVFRETVLDARRGDAESLAWIASDVMDAPSRLFTYLQCCNEFGLDVEATRSAIARMAPLPALWNPEHRSRIDASIDDRSVAA